MDKFEDAQAIRIKLTVSEAVIEELSETQSQLKETLCIEQAKNATLIRLLRDARWRIVNKNTSTDDYQRLDKPLVDAIDEALKSGE